MTQIWLCYVVLLFLLAGTFSFSILEDQKAGRRRLRGTLNPPFCPGRQRRRIQIDSTLSRPRPGNVQMIHDEPVWHIMT